MLKAPNFKSANELALNDTEYQSLIKVLGMLERGELEHTTPIGRKLSLPFNMGTFLPHPECGSPGCIIGWARFLGGETSFARMMHQRCVGLNHLFGGVGAKKKTLAYINVPEAAQALRNYLTEGEPRWEEIC